MLSKTPWLNTTRFKPRFVFRSPMYLMRRGLVHSNALTGSLISLGDQRCNFLVVGCDFDSTVGTVDAGYRLFYRRGCFRAGYRSNSGLHRHGTDRRGSVVSDRQFIADLFIDLCRTVFGRSMAGAKYSRHVPVILGVIILSSGKSADGRLAEERCYFPRSWARWRSASPRLCENPVYLCCLFPCWRAAVTVGTAFFDHIGRHSWRGGRRALKFDRKSSALVVRRGGGEHRRDFIGILRSQCRQVVRVEP